MNINVRRTAKAFSLIELVIVVAIIGIIALIAVPRMSRGSTGAAEGALRQNLTILRSAIDMYAAEHDGDYPAVASFVDQLCTYTDEAGNDNASKTTTYFLGPYLKSIPVLPVGARKGQNGVAAADAATVGWIYTEATGVISANTTAAEKDGQGVAYNAY